MSGAFSHLRISSEYSITQGLLTIDQIVESASKNSIPSVALTDKSTMFGLVKLVNNCEQAGIKPISGASIRLIFENDDFVVLIPFWAIWPFEVMIAPKKQQRNIAELSDSESRNFAEAISVITTAYDKLFNTSFPYSSGIHQAPTNGKKNNNCHWHMSFYPPLLRSATVKKFMVGYEMFGSPQRDITAEIAAQRIKELV